MRAQGELEDVLELDSEQGLELGAEGWLIPAGKILLQRRRCAIGHRHQAHASDAACAELGDGREVGDEAAAVVLHGR